MLNKGSIPEASILELFGLPAKFACASVASASAVAYHHICMTQGGKISLVSDILAALPFQW